MNWNTKGSSVQNRFRNTFTSGILCNCVTFLDIETKYVIWIRQDLETNIV